MIPKFTKRHGWFSDFWESQELQEAYANVSILTPGDYMMLGLDEAGKVEVKHLKARDVLKEPQPAVDDPTTPG